MSWGRILRGKVGLHSTVFSTKCLSHRNICRDHWCISPFFDPREHVFLPTRNKDLLQSAECWLWIFVLLCTQQAVNSLCSFTDFICGIKWQKEASLNFKVEKFSLSNIEKNTKKLRSWWDKTKIFCQCDQIRGSKILCNRKWQEVENEALILWND